MNNGNKFRLGIVLYFVWDAHIPFGKIRDVATGNKIHFRMSDACRPITIGSGLFYAKDSYDTIPWPKPGDHIIFEKLEEKLGPAANPWMHLIDAVLEDHEFKLLLEPHCPLCGDLIRFHKNGKCLVRDCDCGHNILMLGENDPFIPDGFLDAIKPYKNK